MTMFSCHWLKIYQESEAVCMFRSYREVLELQGVREPDVEPEELWEQWELWARAGVGGGGSFHCPPCSDS